MEKGTNCLPGVAEIKNWILQLKNIANWAPEFKKLNITGEKNKNCEPDVAGI